MIKFLKDFFHLSNSELKGALLLLFLIVAFFIVPRVYFRYKKPVKVDDTEFTNWLKDINRKEDSISNFIAKQKTEKKKNIAKERRESFFNFDPNTVSYKEMISLGFDSKTARILEKYRKKGAKFYSKKDLLKIYGFSDELYNELANYIVFPVKKSKVKHKSKETKNDLVPLFDFDPNIVTYKELKQLGVDGKTANILLKFRGDKTVFYSKKDLMKVYGFSEELYLKLEDYIVFPEKETKQNKEIEIIKFDTIVLDINVSSIADFKKLKGIGSYFAKEIVTYRTKLGGFYNKEQLKEVYGITDELFEKIMDNLVENKNALRKININKTTFKELIRHPYIDKETTVAILKLKKELGSFTKVKDLVYYKTIDKDVFEKIKPYLTVE